MRILIVEDDSLSALSLEILSREFFGGKITQIKTLSTLLSAECYIQENPIDLLFLDVNLHGQEGFQILELYESRGFETVIVSSERDNAVRAFEFPVIDFLPKPFQKERFHKSMRRYSSTKSKISRVKKRIPIKKEGGLHLLSPDSVMYAKADGNYMTLYTKDGKTEKIRKTVRDFQKEFPEDFYKIHRSVLVRPQFVEKLIHVGNSTYEALLKNGIRLPVSRNHSSKTLGFFQKI
ncbi:DNA-binding response regulator [Leptospira gomenensis]|uniref:DNA-binding response regulator n=1 Tax=Leptospira gomenensis TaxID=2484974 RepID=A0A5F1Z1I5_9LEPT|nr:LytTR family DNA-binding domain-containing protein [Leptospira gomenensis]TGK36454.1 DNA-binding response regulator [Leptospira gomenensis]TGK38283.1 DNA-binding response regulator [Leptospira gomenensis]TGK46024.1 DNA-binding response regulator [Leptospira gomenensis]TGK65288.1 DNA-binding response regulator [Leptospira gomenensis]